MILQSLACSPCGGTTTVTTWSAGRVELVLDGVVAPLDAATLEWEELRDVYALTGEAAGDVGGCSERLWLQARWSAGEHALDLRVAGESLQAWDLPWTGDDLAGAAIELPVPIDCGTAADLSWSFDADAAETHEARLVCL